MVARILLTLAGAGTGLKAAWLWWQASRVPIVAGHILDGRPESGDPDIQFLDQLDGFARSVAIAGALNAKAAAWTAAAVLLGGAASVWPS